MAKITSKFQVTVPKAIAARHHLEPGTEVDFESAGDVIRVRVRREKAGESDDIGWRLRTFDEATARQRVRNEQFALDFPELVEPSERGWSREELYDRGLAR